MEHNIFAVYFILCLSFVTHAYCKEHRTPGKVCPPPELIKPCTCSQTRREKYVSLSCDNLKSEETLEDILEKADDYQFGGLTLSSSSLMYITTKLFTGRLLKTIRILQSSLVSMFDKLPPEDNGLENIFLMNSKLTRGLDWKFFSNFKKLKSITITGSPFHKFDQSFSKYVPKSLDTLRIHNCAIRRIEDGSFARLENLAKIYVQNEKITELKRNMFPLQSKIWYFDFSGNHLTSLPEGLFDGMPNLYRIHLPGNFLTTMDEKVFRKVLHKLTIIDVSNNPIKCKCNVQWITKAENHPDRFLGKCKEPTELSGKSLVDLDAEDFRHC